ncbi:hypothetical protein FSP39_006159 [Pinctada imbricata]|uniref:G-protein coupled receptors family 1 profile domain-containing protein n=1 Tax=Pinctada imbricata TaxID=66713 RepID=A0AA88XTM6_PINIB|nr:hypothetical protein FSP39_006159 [Pinctada imbricata]
MNSSSATSIFSSGALKCHSWITQYLNISRKDITLEELNSVFVLRLLGGITFVSLLAVIGLVGNIHVIYIFGWKFAKSTDYKVFVLWLGWIDIAATSVNAPMLLYYLFKPLTFESDFLCKTFRFLQYLCAICSNCALVVIAINRCLKILRPLRLPTTPITAKRNCGISLVIAVCLSWPAIPLFSVVNSPTGIEGVTVRIF